MRLLRVLSLGLAAAFAGTLGLSNLGSADAQQGGKDKVYRVHLVDVEAMTTKKNGDTWDINEGKPDLVVRIKNLSDKTIKEFVSKEKTDTFKAALNEPTILVSAGQKLEIEVIDVDIAAHDRVGLKKLTLTQEMLDKGKLRLAFDRVKALNIEFKAP